MKISKMFELTRGKLGDKLTPYRNSDQDLVDGLTLCIDYLWINRKDLFLDDNMKLVNDYVQADERVNTHSYQKGDMIYINDPINLYICTTSGTSGVDVTYTNDVVIDGTSMFSRFTFHEGINLLFVSHYIAYHCLMLDADEQANETLASNHYSMFINGI